MKNKEVFLNQDTFTYAKSKKMYEKCIKIVSLFLK